MGARRGGGGGTRHLALQARHVEGEEPAVFDDAAGDLVLAGRELRERNLLAAPDPVDQREIGAR